MLSVKKISLYLAYYIAVFAVIYALFVGYGFWNGLVIYVGIHMKINEFKYGYLIFPLLDMSFVVIPLIIFACIYKRKHLNRPVQKHENNIALIIPCHKAENIIGETLKHALSIFEPESIFVIDNGNSKTPLDQTRYVCEEYGVNYQWVPIGTKIGSIYIGTKLAKRYNYILQIDDDMILDKNMTFPIKDDTDCIAYIISAINKDNNPNLVQKCQDVEYKVAGITKAVQTWLGNVSFAHGAISLWKRESLIEVLENHPMYPISDDWFIGFVANTLGMRIRVCDQKFISTDTPRTLFWGGRQSGYGSATLWMQRFYRWYALIILQTVYNLYYLFFVWKFSTRRVVFQKLFMIWQCGIMSLMIFRYAIFAYSMYLQYQFTLIVFSSTLITWIITYFTFNFCFLKRDERFDWYMFFVFPCYKFQDTFVCIAGMLYGLFYKIPNVLIEDKIDLKNNEKIQAILNTPEIDMTEVIVNEFLTC